ncbi:MAG: cyclic nucleotide-binding domain-containing protein [Halioglobus sp.]|nr:cyclic nucleotide-binding domain-containing protein [Halioglobus sp.]
MTEVQQLSERDTQALLRWADAVQLQAGERLLRAGDPGDRMYLVLEGAVSIERPLQDAVAGLAEQRGPGDLVGTLAFFSGIDNPCDVRCVAAGRFAGISRATFDALLERQPDLWRRLQEIGLLRMRKVQLAAHLDRLFGPFGPMQPYVLQDLEADIQWLSLRSGQTLFEQGAACDGVYVLMTGRLQMATGTAGGRETIDGTVVAGETVGELALLTGRAQTHTVFAARDSELVRLSGRGFELLLSRNTRAIHNVSRILVDRLASRRMERDPARMPIRCIGLLPARPDVELSTFASELEQHLRRHGSTLRLHSQGVESALGSPVFAQAQEQQAAGLRLNQWLCEQEEAWRYLVYQGDLQWSTWSARCVRQADVVVVVADAASAQSLGDIAARVADARQRWSLVLLHPAGTDRPRDTAARLRDTHVESVFHVRRGHPGDQARLARMLTGNAVGLVLGGGGARGFAHLGVLRALEELGIPVDLIGGTSMGAPIAGLVAQGCREREIARRSAHAFDGIIDFTLPLVSLISGERISSSIERQTGSWDIEDFWLPFFCVSTNLSTSEMVVHRRGNSARAIRCSVSIPGVLPPVASGGALLVDGAVLNNLPVDVMREINPFGTVIAVDVTPRAGLVPRADCAAGLSGWRVLANKLLPWREPPALPGIASTIMRATFAGSSLKRQQALEQNLADVYLHIDVEAVGMFKFEAREQAAQLGYDGAIAPLRAWAREALPGLLGAATETR